MQKMPYSLIISDLHLSENHPEITKLFLSFINNVAITADSLYILGDLFEFWIGDDDQTPFHRQIIAALQNLSKQGVKIYILPGNRDFLLGKQFMQTIGAEKLAECTLVNLHGNKIVLAHGDSLCWDDKSYQRYRKIVQQKWIQGLFLVLPLSLRRKIAAKIRRHSSGQSVYQDVNTAAVTQVFTAYSADYLIHGHTHRLAVHYHESHKQRLVLGAWHEFGSYIMINAESLSISSC